MAAATSRPNSLVPDAALAQKIVLCCGEDPTDFINAVESVMPGRPLFEHEFRCYRFWVYPRLTLVWTGIGSGCLEPLLFEMFMPGSNVLQIVLIGTGGTLAGKLEVGVPHLVEQAFLGGSAIEPAIQPLEPRINKMKARAEALPRCAVVSTDYYYGYWPTKDHNRGRLRRADKRLDKGIDETYERAQMVDMEVGQFYHFCKTLGRSDLEYAAVKAAANPVDEPSVQLQSSRKVLSTTFLAALGLLGVEQPSATGRATRMDASTKKDDAEGDKLMEEVKLFWTIQIAVVGVLGYLGSLLLPEAPKETTAPGAPSPITSPAWTQFMVCTVCYVLLSIGCMYNLVGNYYTHQAGKSRFDQEGIVTPLLAGAYLGIAFVVGLLGWAFFRQAVPLQDPHFRYRIGGLIGYGVNWLLGCLVYRALRRKGGREYSEYTAPLRRIYCSRWSVLIGVIMLGAALVIR